MGSGVGSADADVAEFAGDAQCDTAGFADLVAAESMVGVALVLAARGGFGSGGVCGHGCGVVR
jgi:muramoyltetrapeptide carboxypeptidase LdcA involved in peptidoglycan recycling